MKLNITIITKKLGIILLITLMLIAGFFRLWRINELAEFLGDQGRTGMVILDAYRTGSIPLVGPTVLSGQHLGPFFYYLIGPAFILGGFNPLVPSVFMALLGVASVELLFVLAKKLFGYWIGWGVALLYAVAPYLIRADRTIWEPTVIPFFVLLYAFYAYELVEQRKYWYLLPMGIVVGILVQLHYPMVFFVGLSTVLFLLLWMQKPRARKPLILWSLAGIGGFLFVLFPFLLYEAQHAWADIREIAIIFVAGGGGQASYTYPQRLLDDSSKLFGYLAPEAPRWFIVFMQGFTLVAAFWRRTFWSLFLAGWYMLGIAMIGLYRGVVFDHYLFFLLPLPYLLLGHTLWLLRKYISAVVVMVCIGYLIVINIGKTDIFLSGFNDISRVSGIVNEMMISTKNEPFSFTLTSSRSFSDLHYRYFFKLAGVEPVHPTDTSYNTLFLICDQLPCPTTGKMSERRSVAALCFEPHCKGTYPTIDLTAWKFTASLYAPEGRIYMYRSTGGDR